MEKVIEGYSGYTVSDEGEVFSTKYKQKRKLKSRKNENGYLYENLSKDGHYKTHTIHILVAKAFVPNPRNLPQVNHKDANKTNNSASNLEWCTQSEN